MSLTSNEAPAKVDMLQAMVLRLEIRNLADVVADGIQQAPAYILLLKPTPRAFRYPVAIRTRRQLLRLLLKDFPEAGGDGGSLEPDAPVPAAVNVANQHVDVGVVALFGERKHLVEAARVGEDGEKAPEGAAAELLGVSVSGYGGVEARVVPRIRLFARTSVGRRL